MIRKWEMAFWTLLAGSTAAVMATQCAAYGMPYTPDSQVEIPEDLTYDDLSDISDFLEQYDIPMDLEAETTEEPDEEEIEEDAPVDSEDAEDEE